MLILDPKSGQSVVVDLTAKHSPAVESCGSPNSRKVPPHINDILIFNVRFRLRTKHKNIVKAGVQAMTSTTRTRLLLIFTAIAFITHGRAPGMIPFRNPNLETSIATSISIENRDI